MRMGLVSFVCLVLAGCAWHVSGKPLIHDIDQCRINGAACVDGASVTLTHLF